MTDTEKYVGGKYIYFAINFLEFEVCSGPPSFYLETSLILSSFDFEFCLDGPRATFSLGLSFAFTKVISSCVLCLMLNELWGFHIFSMGLCTNFSPVWVPGTFTAVPFEKFYPLPWRVDSRICWSVLKDLRGTLCRSLVFCSFCAPLLSGFLPCELWLLWFPSSVSSSLPWDFQASPGLPLPVCGLKTL